MEVKEGRRKGGKHGGTESRRHREKKISKHAKVKRQYRKTRIRYVRSVQEMFTSLHTDAKSTQHNQK